MQNIFWKPVVRILLFWAVVSLSIWLAAVIVPVFSPSALIQGIAGAQSNLSSLSKPEFVYALAVGIVVFAAALAVAFTLLHTLPPLGAFHLRSVLERVRADGSRDLKAWRELLDEQRRRPRQ